MCVSAIVFLCVSVCVYVCVCLCMCVCLYVCVSVCVICICMCVCMFAFILHGLYYKFFLDLYYLSKNIYNSSMIGKTTFKWKSTLSAPVSPMEVI